MRRTPLQGKDNPSAQLALAALMKMEQREVVCMKIHFLKRLQKITLNETQMLKLFDFLDSYLPIEESVEEEYKNNLYLLQKEKQSMPGPLMTYILEEGRQEGRLEGESSGLIKGEKIGWRKKAVDVAQKMKLKNIALDIISQCTGLSKEEIKAL